MRILALLAAVFCLFAAGFVFLASNTTGRISREETAMLTLPFGALVCTLALLITFVKPPKAQ